LPLAKIRQFHPFPPPLRAQEDAPITTIHDTPPQNAAEKSDSYRFALAVAELAANTRCENVVLLDLRGRSQEVDFFVIATGTSPRQMRTVVDETQDLGKSMGFKAWKISGYEDARWILVDCVNVVVHVFETDARDFYDLELLWGDSPRIDWRKELGLPPAPELHDASAVSSRERFREAAGMDNLDAEQEDARLDGRDLDAEEQGDADIDEDAEDDAPIVMELPDESTGSNSVEFVEIDPPAKRRQRGRAVYPTPIGDQDEADEEAGMHKVQGAGLGAANQSLDEDDDERAAESARDNDPEATSSEDLPQDRLVSKPMGGVSANMTGGSIVERDEDAQSESRDLDDVEQDHRDEIPEAHEAASEGTTFAKRTSQQAGVDVDAEGDADRSPRGKVMKDRTAMKGPRPGTAAPGRVNVDRAKAGVVKGRGRKSVEGGIADAPDTAGPRLPVRKMSKASEKTGAAAGNVRKVGAKATARGSAKTGARGSTARAGGRTAARGAAKKAAPKKAAAKKPAAKKAAPKKAAPKKPAAKAKKPAPKKRR
jgi:ribosome-associated protein